MVFQQYVKLDLNSHDDKIRNESGGEECFME